MNDSRSATPIAVVGIGCWYPGARSPLQLWEGVLARRREFRLIPDGRLPLAEYYDPDPGVPDMTYCAHAAVIDGFEFDWVGKRIPKPTFETTDVVQWLALDVALQAMEDAGYTFDSLPAETTSVVLGNSLTGEQSRTDDEASSRPHHLDRGHSCTAVTARSAVQVERSRGSPTGCWRCGFRRGR